MGKHNVQRNIELLAPAGSYESFVAAINAGADAVYMGLKKFNARVMTDNLDISQYKEAIDYAHKRDVKVYLTLNTLVLNCEIKEALESLYELYTVGLDGVIVQDLGLADLIHKIMPDLSLHASTQMSICSLEQVKELEKLGFERVVLARELSIEEITEIATNTSLEVEVFVHGALCVSVSGQCLMSSMIGNRSANRGSCAGPCRKRYSLYNSKGECIQKGRYLLSKKDIFGLDKLQALIEAGVCSLKIEGRNKVPEYVAGVIKNYRDAIDIGYSASQDSEVLQLFNRSGKSDGYLQGVKYRQSISEYTPKNTGLYLGKVLQIKKQYIKIKLEESIGLHDGIECQTDATASTIVTCIRDQNFKVLNEPIQKNNIVWLGDINNVKVGDNIFKTSDSSLNIKYKKYSTINLKRIEHNILVTIKKNSPLRVSANSIDFEIDYIPALAKTASLNEEKVKEIFSNTESTSVKFNVNVLVDEGLFVPVSKLNELRNLFVERLESEKLVRNNIQQIDEKIEQALKVEGEAKQSHKVNSLYIYKYNPEIQYVNYYENKYNGKLNIMYVNVADFKKYEQDILKYLDMCKVYFVIPNITLKNTSNYIDENLERLINSGITGVLIGNIGYLSLCKKLKEKYNIEIVADYTLNITNKYTALKLKEYKVDVITPLCEKDLDLTDIYGCFNTELVDDLISVMTTRYCVISSFAKNSVKKSDCQFECKKQEYYLADERNKRYDIITDSLDCITRLVTLYDKGITNSSRIRHCII